MKITQDMTQKMTMIKKTLMMVLMVTFGTTVSWGQTDYSGVYYIKHNADATYYLCTSTVFYDGNHYANSGDMPYLTTATESTIATDWDKDAVWRIIKAELGNYYYVVHAVDGKYLTLNDDPTNFVTDKNNPGNRLSLHLQYIKDEENSLFIITKNDKEGWYNISPKNKSEWSLNPAGGNYDTRAAANAKPQAIPGLGNKNCGGLIGLWENKNTNSKWQFAEVTTSKPICEAPTFTNNGSLSISCSTDGATIYYTTDGSTVPTTSSTNGNSVTVTEDIDVVWARATTQDNEPYYWSPLTVYEIPQCAKPVISIINGKLNLSCAIDGATIYYTINGTDPTTEYDPNNKPDVTENDIIKAVATKNGYHKSNVASTMPPQTIHNSSEIDNMFGHYILASDFVVSLSVGTEAAPFGGVIDGGLNTFSGFDKALVAYANGATIRNVILDNVTISGNGNGNAGAICCEATGDTRIYNCGVKSGTISGTNAGSIVGKLNGNSRVINCYSFATVNGGAWGAGIVGYNSFSSTRSDLRTMVMNCMFYGEISSGTNISPIYGGLKITNVSNLNGYNYYRFDANYSRNNNITAYNCALAAEEKYLTRFEFFRNTLNSNRELAAWYATNNPNDGKGIGNACKMAKWVLDPADKPYPILKAQDYYPSFINYEDAPNLGTIDLTINESNTTTGGKEKPSGASINSNYPTTLTVYDKDLDHKHFNYRTVRLPYYNEVGTGNCTKYKVVTGWKITGFSGGTQGQFVKGVLDYSGTTHGEDEYAPYNFADRYCTDKDKYAVSGRVFSQGAYYDVPEGVTGITIEPYWGTAVYLSDPTYDVAYPEGYGDKNANAVFVSNMGVRYENDKTASINDDNQKVYTNYTSAYNKVASSGTVYDNAIVLVGNYHHYWGPYSPSTGKAFTVMSADLNNDCEPDYSFIVQHGTNRQEISQIRFDFINSPGLGMIQKVETDRAIPKHGIWYPKGWFEVTNTTLIQFTQFEYDRGGKPAGSPLILLGGLYDQFVTARTGAANSTEYIHLGGNIWMKEFCNGTHTANSSTPTTRHIPISVTGGEFESFYLTGTFRPSVESVTDNAECYINGGKFGDVAGAGQEQLKGDVTWLIDHADITNFYGGGINDQKPVLGHIYVEINNSNVGLYCGGPKFGNMQDDMKVTTKAKGSTFGNFYGAGYGGTSYFRDMTKDKTGEKNWDTWNSDYTRKYVAGKGISTEYECEFIPYSGGQSGQADYVGRFYVLYASLSLAKTKNVESTLEDCHITGSFYGGGKLGSVDGNITSTLKNCTVDENVFGAGFSASVETVNVVPKGAKMKTNPAYNESVGVFTDGVYPDGVEYTWTQVASVSAGHEFDNTNHLIYTTTDLTTLGAVTGSVTLIIDGNTTLTDGKVMTVGESVYGGGEESGVDGDTDVTVNGGKIGVQNSGEFGYRWGNVYGGGKGKITIKEDGSSELAVSSIDDLDAGLVKGNTNVTINGTTEILHNVYGGGAVGSVGTFERDSNGMPTACAANTGLATVTINGGKIGHNHQDAGMVDGSSRGWEGNPNGTGAFAFLNQLAWVNNTNVTIGSSTSDEEDKGPTVFGSVYGGGENGHNFQNGVVIINKGTIGNKSGTWDCGNIYGAGCGTDTFWRDDNDNGVEDDGESGHHNPMAGIVRGTTSITVNGGHVLRNVYGGGSMGSVGTYTYDENGLPTTCEAGTGSATININGGTIGETDTDYGHVFGGPKGNLSETEFSASVRGTQVNINTGADIKGSVFGGGEAGTVKESVTVNMTGGQVLKDVYGGGALANTQTSNWNTTGGTWADAVKKSALHTTTVHLTGGRVGEEVFGGGLGEAGKPAYVWGDVLVDLNGETIANNGTSPISTSSKGCIVNQLFGCNNVNGSPKGDVLVHVHATQNGDASKTNITSKFAKDDEDLEQGESSETDYIAKLKRILADKIVIADKLSITVTDYQAVVDDDDATVAALKTALTSITTAISAKTSDEDMKTINGTKYDVYAVYGGGNLAAYEPVGPNPNATDDDGKNTTKSTKVIIDGCGLTSIETVYGGGNAASTPATETTVNGTYEIYELFGGGNGKDKLPGGLDNPGANVGFYDYSAVESSYPTKEDRAGTDFVNTYTYGTGKATVNVFGGTIHRVFGGSNTKGNVRQTALTLLDENSGCDFCIDEAYGGGKSAEMDAEAKLLMACIPGLDAVYGGAEAADVHGDVTLNITNGTFQRVFGGNNLSGTIGGAIKVNIEEVGCKPIIIGELYGGGNQAGYSIYGYDGVDANGKAILKENGSNPWADPEVNVISFTSIGEIYGGGFGADAVMVGSPKVNINEAVGTPETYPTTGDFDVTGFKGKTFTIDEGKATEHTVTCPAHEKGKMGAIGKVFGGGNAAQVKGNTSVNIGTTVGDISYVEVDVEVGTTVVTSYYIRTGAGTSESPYTYTDHPSVDAGTCDASGKAVTGQTYYRKVEIMGADIRGNVYGGGNNAEVTGNTDVNIGKKEGN